MNIFAQLFGIFRQRGLVATLKNGEPLTGFILAVVLLTIIGGGLYGFAMGIGLGIDTAIKDAIKVSLIATLTMILSIPIFWVAYRLLGREERLGQVSAVPLTLVATVALIMALTAPVVFMLSVLAGFNPEAVYIHIVIIDLALLVGLYLAGTMIFHTFSDSRGLIIPNVVSFVMMGVILVVLVSFLGPFLSIRPSFSVGTDRLKDGLGIGVADKVKRSLAAAEQADRVTYTFQMTNENGDLMRDYLVTRVGNDYLIKVTLHAVQGEIYQNDRRIWVLDGSYYTDFDHGRVVKTTEAALSSFLSPALPPAPFSLPEQLRRASWRAFERGDRYTATGTTETQEQVTSIMDVDTGRLIELYLGRAGGGVHAEMRVTGLDATTLDRTGLEASLNQSMVIGDVDRSDAAMRDYIQEHAFFVVRYPRSWRAGTWDSTQRRVDLTTSCGNPEGCPVLTVQVYDLAANQDARDYATELAHSLGLQVEFRDVAVSTIAIDDEMVGVVEYLSDRTVRGELKTTQHIEYIFVGQLYRYHLDFSVPQAQFEASRGLFQEMARLFTCLKSAP